MLCRVGSTSLLLTRCLSAACSISRADIHHLQTKSHLNWLSVSLVIYSLIFTLSYLLYPNPLLHQVRTRGQAQSGRMAWSVLVDKWDEWTDEWIDGWDEWDEWTDEWMDKWDELRDEWMYEV